MNDTIAAIATALGTGSISIIRVSGKESIEIVNKIFEKKDLTKVSSHTIHYGHIVVDGKIIDEVLVSVMKAPKTFTTEDVVEINCHGGIATTKRVLEELLVHGCRLAEPGEFTKRAFLNGRIDLLEAESVMDVIQAKTEKARELSMNQLSGSVSGLIKNIRESLISIISQIEVNIDYPEYEDLVELKNNDLIPTIKDIKERMQKLLQESKNGILIKEGIQTAIIGRPNAGKSSLLNDLLEEEKAIVTSIAGTTRDLVEGDLELDGVLFHIIDTAGIRNSSDVVEQIGIQKSMELIKKADLVLFVLNQNEPLNEEEKAILKQLQNKKYLLVVNKIDLDKKIEDLDSEHTVYISALNHQGISDLKDKIKELFDLENLESKDMTYLTNARSISIMRECYKQVEILEQKVNEDLPVDLLVLDLREVWNLLGTITGETYEEELLDQLFSRFCLGK